MRPERDLAHQRLRVRIRVLLVAVCSLAVQPGHGATEAEIIAAAQNDPRVQARVRELQSLIVRGEIEPIQAVRMDGLCGVAGCSFSSLVVIRVTRETANPQSGAVLALVEGMNGRIQRVRLVELGDAHLPSSATD